MDVLFQIAIILISAKTACEICSKLKISPVVGEILVGVVLGGSVLGWVLPENEFLRTLSEISVIFLIFVVGLESNIKRLIKHSGTASIVAFGGIVFPLGGGYLIARYLGFGWEEAIVTGAILTATSIAVTARVFMDIGKIRSKEAQTILGAAIIDDILGILILTFVLSVASHQGSIVSNIISEAEFLFIIVPILWIILPKALSKIHHFEGESTAFVLMLGVLFLTSYIAKWAGLATIIGAFFVGLILSTTRSASDFLQDTKPIYYFLSPIFFVFIGVEFDLTSFIESPWIAIILTITAFSTKFIGGFLAGMISKKDLTTSSILGLGMTPRGEVALIAALTGKQLGLVSVELFNGVAFMAMVTTLITPVLLHQVLKYKTNKIVGDQN